MKLFKQTLHRFAVLVLCVSLLAGILLPAQAAATFSPRKRNTGTHPSLRVYGQHGRFHHQILR